MFFELQRTWIISHDTIDNLEDIPDRKDTYEDLVTLCHIRQMKWKFQQPKRRHRKSHNTITFRDISKRIARKWKEMNPMEKELYVMFACQEKKKYEIARKMQQQHKHLMKTKEVIHCDDSKTASYESDNTYSLNLQVESELSHQKNYIETGNEVVKGREDNVACKIQCRNSTTTGNNVAPTTIKETEIINLSSSFDHDSNILDNYFETKMVLSSDVTYKTPVKCNEEFIATNTSKKVYNVFDEDYESNYMNHNYICDDHYVDNIEDNNNNNYYLESIDEMEKECDKIDEQIFTNMKRIHYRSISIEKKMILSKYNIKTDDGGCIQSSQQSPTSVINYNNESSVDPFNISHFNDPSMMMTDMSSSLRNILGDIEEEVSKNEGFDSECVNDELNEYQSQTNMPEIDQYLDDNSVIMIDDDEFMDDEAITARG